MHASRDLSSLSLCLLLAAALGAAGCGRDRGPKPDTTGAAKIALTGSAVGSDVVKVTVTITKGDGPDFPAIVGNLTKSGSDWAGYVSGVPAGKGRRFELVAYDAAQRVVLTGFAKTDIVSGAVATVVIFLSRPGTGTENHAPVIEYLTASSTLVKPLQKVALAVRAKDPDPGEAVTLLWGATCGAFDAPTAGDVVWTAPDGAGTCQLSITATDPHAVSVTAYLVVLIDALGGDAQVNARINTSPIVSWIRGDLFYRDGGVDGDLELSATDPDGDALTYAWTTSCADLAIDTRAPYGPTRPHVDRPTAQGSCVVSGEVTDGHGGRTVATLVIGPEPTRNVAPVITSTVQPAVDLADPLRPSIVLPGATVSLGAYARDPEGGAITFRWTVSAGAISGQVDQSDRTAALFTVPSPFVPGVEVTLRATDPQGAFSEHVFRFKVEASADPCLGKPDGTACTDGSACTRTDTCQGGVCTGADPVVCAAPAACRQPGVCQPTGAAAGTCTYANVPDGASCSDGLACTGADACVAGACTPGASVCASNEVCSPSGACVCVPACSGRACGSDGCGGSCGTCPTGNTCTTGGQCVAVCVPACTGLACGPDGCGGTCGTCATGTTCNPSGQCVAACTPSCSGKVCGPDGCGGTCGTCAGGTTCSAGGQCVGAVTTVVPKRVNGLRVSPPAGVAMDPAGNTYAVSSLSSLVDADFQTRPGGAPILLRSQGGSDAFVARYDANGDITWAVTVQDNAPTASTDQYATLVAVNQAGRVGVTGKFAGTVTFGTTTAGGANPTPYVAAFEGATGARLWVNGYDLGSNGLFQSIAANPGQAANRFAACGFADAAATQLAPGATFGGVQDLVIGAWDNAGTRLWGRQVGGTGTENCGAVAIDAGGNVIAVGQFDGATLDLGNGFTLTGPGSGTRKFMWIARFDGATGQTLAAAVFSGTLGNAIPRSLTVTPSGGVAVGGSFSGNLAIGAAMTSTGSEDGFVALLSSAFAPAWNARRVGGTGLDLVRSVAVTSAGDLVALGNFAASSAAFRTTNGADTTGIAGLTSLGGADAMVLKLSGATGATEQGRSFGNSGTQSGDVLGVAGLGANQVVLTITSPATIDFGGGVVYTSVGAADAALLFARVE